MANLLNAVRRYPDLVHAVLSHCETSTIGRFGQTHKAAQSLAFEHGSTGWRRLLERLCEEQANLQTRTDSVPNACWFFKCALEEDYGDIPARYGPRIEKMRADARLSPLDAAATAWHNSSFSEVTYLQNCFVNWKVAKTARLARIERKIADLAPERSKLPACTEDAERSKRKPRKIL